MQFTPIQVAGKTYYINACRVHPNPTSTEYTVWEKYHKHSHSTVSYSNNIGCTLGMVGKRVFDCDLPASPARTALLAEHRGSQAIVALDVLDAACINGEWDSMYFEMIVEDSQE